MGSRTLLILSLILVSRLILGSGQLQIELEKREPPEQLEKDIDSLFEVIDTINHFHSFYCFITYTGTFDLRPSLEQRLMERIAVPIYTVGSNQGPLNRRYSNAVSMVIIFFSGLDDPGLAALNDTELSNGSRFFAFLYIAPGNGSRHLTMDQMREFFAWCWDRGFVRSLLFFRGESEFEAWGYFYLKNLTLTRLSYSDDFKSVLRRQGLNFSVQVANDIPEIYWYNSAEQTDVISGNISLSGPIGLLVVEFMRYINASMDILPIEKPQSSKYEIFEVASDRRVDMVANLVADDSYFSSPIVTDSQICLVLPRFRRAPINKFLDRSVTPEIYIFLFLLAVCVFGVKYLAHRRRGIVDTLFSTFRFVMGIPLPGGQLNRLPLADKIMEVYSFMLVGIVIGACASLLSTALTTGIHYPPITDVKSMRASGLRILTSDPTIKQAFEDNIMPNSLADLVDLSEDQTVYQKFIELNDNVVYVVQTPNWRGYQLYQQRLYNKRFGIAGPELCSNVRHLRLPITPNSPIMFTFQDYYRRIFESGLQQKWLLMAYQKHMEIMGISTLPVDEANEWKPLNLNFFSVFIKIYIGGMLLSIVIFILELVYKRYGNR